MRCVSKKVNASVDHTSKQKYGHSNSIPKDHSCTNHYPQNGRKLSQSTKFQKQAVTGERLQFPSRRGNSQFLLPLAPNIVFEEGCGIFRDSLLPRTNHFEISSSQVSIHYEISTTFTTTTLCSTGCHFSIVYDYHVV